MRPCSPQQTRGGARSELRTSWPAPPTQSCATSSARASRATRFRRASSASASCRAMPPARSIALRFSRVLLQHRPERRADRHRAPARRIDADVDGRGGCTVLSGLVVKVVFHPEAALADAPDRQPDHDQLPEAEGPLEGGFRMAERHDLLAPGDELVQRHPVRAEEVFQGLMAIDEDVGEEDDPRRIAMLEADVEAVLERCHLGSRYRMALYTGRGSPPSAACLERTARPRRGV